MIASGFPIHASVLSLWCIDDRSKTALFFFGTNDTRVISLVKPYKLLIFFFCLLLEEKLLAPPPCFCVMSMYIKLFFFNTLISPIDENQLSAVMFRFVPTIGFESRTTVYIYLLNFFLSIDRVIPSLPFPEYMYPLRK